MGVIPNLNTMLHSNEEEEWIYISSDGEEAAQSGHLNNFGKKRHQSKTKKSSNKPEPTFAALGIKGKSHKKFRRYANGTFDDANLLNEFGSLVNENELDEITINDFIPSTPSSFSLLMNQMIDSSFDYNEFINCTEEEQKILLKGVYEISKMDANGTKIDYDTEDYQLCFARIAPDIRKRLLKKHVPLGILASIEQKVVEHFRSYPQSTYKTMLNCSYQRFLLHACCQYLNLYCRSSTTKGKRLSCVQNGRLNFIEPSKLLSEYLDLNH